MKDIVISLFDDSGNLMEPWMRAGYLCLVVDIINPEVPEAVGNLVRMRADLSKPFECPVPTERVAFVSCHPPCDDVANSGNRWKKGKGLRALARAVECFATSAEFCESVGAPYMIENPVGSMSTYWRKSDYGYHPYEYSGYAPEDYYLKHTRLWTSEDFVMPEPMFDAERYARGVAQMAERKRLKDPTYPCPDYPDNRIHFASPGPMRAYFRSVTPRGFGEAVFRTNGKPLDTQVQPC